MAGLEVLGASLYSVAAHLWARTQLAFLEPGLGGIAQSDLDDRSGRRQEAQINADLAMRNVESDGASLGRLPQRNGNPRSGSWGKVKASKITAREFDSLSAGGRLRA
jgi:hypothetical protein